MSLLQLYLRSCHKKVDNELGSDKPDKEAEAILIIEKCNYIAQYITHQLVHAPKHYQKLDIKEKQTAEQEEQTKGEQEVAKYALPPKLKKLQLFMLEIIKLKEASATNLQY
ncbi:hypothetical protein BDF19DRAFT_410487 [Syncephalis fuscata]|nr:hypothetical protein BDF19DRAFT_410487 [Syncephalis fuscata]